MKRPSLRTPLALAITLALAAPNLSLAATRKEKELETRVAQLEAQVKALVNAQQQQQAQLDTTRAQAADANARVADARTELDKIKATQPAPLAAGKQPIQATAINTGANPGTTFSYGGFIKLDAMATKTSDGKMDDGSAGRIFYLPSQIPVGGATANGGNAYTDISAQLSRFWLSADTVTQRGDKLKGYVEMDFYGGGSNALNGNETSTNTYGVTLRQAYVQWNNWLAGQTWSNFQDTAALPDAVDFVGPTDGTIFVRQAQIRYAKGNWSFSAENPQTTIGSVATGARLANSGANVMPDLTARYTTKGGWGHFSVAVLARQFEYQNKLANGSYQSAKTATGGAVSVAGNFNIGSNDDLRYMVNAGSGIGRYLAFGLGSDTVLDADNNLHALDGYGGFVSWRHAFSPKLRGNLMYSMAAFDNNKSLPGWGIVYDPKTNAVVSNSWTVTERTSSIHANLIYSPIPKLDLGAEITYGKRDLEDNRSGDLKRIQATVKYSF